jgi:ceramide glucosyltransferase
MQDALASSVGHFGQRRMSAESILRTFAALHFAVCTSGYAYGLCATLRRRSRSPPGATLLPSDLRISALKPLHGLDHDLESNLESFARLEAVPELEVLLLVDDAKDPAWSMAVRMAETYPRRFRVIVGTNGSCKNPKIGSLLHALPHASHELIWITDSNVETSGEHLNAHLWTWAGTQRDGRRPALIHAPIAAVRGSGLGARCERLQLVSYNNVSHEIARLAGVDAVIGKSLLVHREDFARVGGLEAFADASGEDYLLGRAFHANGIVACTSEATRQVLGERLGLGSFFERQRRWATLRRQMSPATFYCLEHFTYFGIPLVLACVGLLSWSWVGLAFLFKMTGDGMLIAAYVREPPRLLDVLFLPVKELLLLGAWLSAMVNRQISWRGRSLQVEGNGSYSRL